MRDYESTQGPAAHTNAAPAPKSPRATLYYDGQCPLCRREMKLLDKHKRDSLKLLDIHLQWQWPVSQREAMLRQLHLRLPDGRWLKGVEASVAAWRHTPFGRWFEVLRWRPLAPLVDRLYARWAERRFKRLYGGGERLCHLPEDADNDA